MADEAKFSLEEAIAEAKVLGQRAAGVKTMEELPISTEAMIKFVKLQTEFEGEPRRQITSAYYDQFEEKV
jgi:hypothetical protein